MKRDKLEIFGPIAVTLLASAAGFAIFAPLLAAIVAPIVN